MIDERTRKQLLDISDMSIRHGLEKGAPLKFNINDLPAPLREPGASFVTLKIHGQLRGCIGALQATQALGQDVADHAWAAAFQDPRFAPLREDEYPLLDIHISVLEPAETIDCHSEDELLAQLRPGEDGLILEDGPRRATFLPSVWESLPDKRDFVQQLKLKAGMPANYWSPSMRCMRYSVEEFGGHVAA
ncbi:MAG TPA: AmmeMemoRadiSam system protein A [Gammaproteobacteria bacterium]|nr:AmmeMemoRadiSam system protein A [Gammaproteobacteria bacterium]